MFASARGPYLACSLVSQQDGKTKLEFETPIRDDGATECAARGHPFDNRTFVLREVQERRDRDSAEVREMTARITKARVMALRGDKDGAEKFLKEFIATSPGQRWVDEANQLLKQLDYYVQQGAALKRGPGN